jgi:hypothetical protein
MDDARAERAERRAVLRTRLLEWAVLLALLVGLVAGAVILFAD